VAAFKRILLVVIYILLFQSSQAQKTRHVVIAVIDGARYTETFGDSSHSNIAYLWQRLCPLGTYFTNLSNDDLTLTDPGHSNIITGTWQKLENNGHQRPASPNIFEYFRKQNNADSLQCWVVLGKSKLDILSGSDLPEYGHGFSASVKYSSDELSDVSAFENAEFVLKEYHPRLTVINFPHIDYMAHQANWDGYISAIRQVDTLVASLWNVIQADPVLHDKTALIVTNDHGRHTIDFSNHGDECEGCRHIMLLMIGPDIPAGTIDTMKYKQIDIAPTIGNMMGFKTPNSTGVIIKSCAQHSSDQCK
jgi:predicted AlkP superfamily pyrophosphatase or phosphodiesterase